MQRGQGLMKSTMNSGAVSGMATWRPGEGAAPRTRWADAGGVSIAYQEFGEGPLDIALVFGWLTHVEMAWRHPALAGFLRRVGRLGRVLFFDRRGTGLSDRGSRPATLDERVADLRAVMDEVGSKRAVLFGVTQGIATCAAAAAAEAGRTAGLVLFGGTARTLRAPDHPFGMTAQELDALADRIRSGWGDPLFIEANAPSMAGDAGFASWWAEAMRMSASPGQAVAMLRASAEVDLRPLLPKVRAPALVLNRSADRVTSVDEARDLTGRIAGAKLVALP